MERAGVLAESQAAFSRTGKWRAREAEAGLRHQSLREVERLLTVAEIVVTTATWTPKRDQTDTGTSQMGS